jgi:hypothetical protein
MPSQGTAQEPLTAVTLMPVATYPAQFSVI